MADKYIIHGATYNGDGTTSSAAASNGAPGAWNTITYFEGTTPAYGTLAAGDTVYIRSKDAAGNPLTFIPGGNTNLGSSAASAAAPIVWIIDNSGTIWSGVTGSLVYNHHTPTVSRSMTVLANNTVIADVQDGFVFRVTNVSGTDSYLITLNGDTKNVWHDKTAQNDPTNNYTSSTKLGQNTTHTNLHHTTYKPGSSASMGRALMSLNTWHGIATLINPQIEILNSRTGGQVCFDVYGTYQQLLNVVGGRVYGAGATTGQALLVLEGPTGVAFKHNVFIHGLNYPKEMNIFNPAAEPVGYANIIDITGCDEGAGAHYETGWGYVTSRTDNNPPTLSTTLPDGALTPWAWRLYPRNTLPTVPAQLDLVAYSQAESAAKTITLEFLAESNYTPTYGNTWMEVSYTDLSGVARTESTVVPNSTTVCASSTAAWSTTNWYISTFNKFKIEITTANSVKQGTIVTVTFRTSLKAASAYQVLFINPEFSVV